MAEINLSIVSSAEDGEDDASSWDECTGAYSSHHYFEVGEAGGTTYSGGLRFGGITIAQGTTITSATLTATINSGGTGGGKSLTIRAYGDDVDDAPAWGSSSRPNSGFTDTTAYDDDTQTNNSTGTDYVWDVTDVVQEIVNRGSWASGNAMRFALRPQAASYNSTLIYDYDADTLSDVATLDIIYSTGASESVPFGTLELVGVAPSTNTVVPVKPESIPLGTIELIGVAPSTNTVSTTSAESIPVGTMTLVGVAPRYENNYTGVEVITLTGFAPEYSINGLVAASIPVATFELTGFAPSILSAGLRTEGIPLGTIELVGAAPVAQVTGGAEEGIPQASLELVGFAPETQRIGDRLYAVDGNVIHLLGSAPGINNKNPRAQPVKKGGVPPYRRWKQRRTVLIGGNRYVVRSYTEERYLLERYIKSLQRKEATAHTEPVELSRKRKIKLIGAQIKRTETRMAKLDQEIAWHRNKLKEEDDLLLSLFG